MLLRYGSENPFRLYSAQKDGAASGNQAAEPVHFRSGMVKGRNTEKHIIPLLTVMRLLRNAGMHQRFMIMQNCFRKSGGSGGKINRGIIGLL